MTLGTVDRSGFGMCAPTSAQLNIAARWTLAVLLNLAYQGEPLRVASIRRRMPGVPPTMLAHALRQLEHDGYVVRRRGAAAPRRVQYALASREPSASKRDGSAKRHQELRARARQISARGVGGAWMGPFWLLFRRF